MAAYDKMYYALFNAITDVLEITESMEPSEQRRKIWKKLCEAQQRSEEIYLDTEESAE